MCCFGGMNEQVVWPPPAAADTVRPRRHAILPNFTGLDSWPWQLRMHQPPIPTLKFVGDTLSVSALIGRATLTFDLGGHGACRRYGSLLSICVPSLKFIGLSIRKIWRTSGLTISRPGDLDLWTLTSKMVRIIARGVCNLLTNFGVSRPFRSRRIGQHLPYASRDLATLTFDLWVYGAYRWCGSSCSVCVPSLKFVGLSFRKILRIYCVNINRPGDLDLWPFDL